MEMLKQNQKDIVSGANVAMPATFTTPLDYSIDLLIRDHPTLRQYCEEVQCVECDPQYKLYPMKKDRLMPSDEI